MAEMQPPAFFSDPVSVAIVIAAVVIVGMSKGGLGGAMGIFGVPLMSLVIPPIKAAAIMLPILLLMDAVSLTKWWGGWDKRTLRALLPGAVIGITIGWLAAAVTSDAMVRLLVGVVALVFATRTALSAMRKSPPVKSGHRPILASICGTIAGFTSFVAHAGGPPFQVYVLPLRLEPTHYVGTSVAFFAIINTIKVAPYAALGQFETENLVASAAMIPIAILATLAGAAIVKRMRAEVFYPIVYTLLFFVSLKLIYDGATALLS